MPDVAYDTAAGIHHYYVVITNGANSVRTPCCSVRMPCGGHRDAAAREHRELREREPSIR